MRLLVKANAGASRMGIAGAQAQVRLRRLMPSIDAARTAPLAAAGARLA